MQGKTVIVRVFGGDLVSRKIWSVGQNVVYVTDEKNYDLLLNNGAAIIPIGVPKEDVFEYDARVNKQRLKERDLKRWKKD